jgi:hypothetical protein
MKGAWLCRGALGLTLGATLGLAPSCLTVPEPEDFACADTTTFPMVSPVLEQRCGSLDCHGALARPLRVYGKNGPRLGGEVTGGSSTSAAEMEATWRSLCGLEPERMAEVQRGDLDPLELMILRKPLLIERHKGGQVFELGDPGESCLQSWLDGELNAEDCETAAKQL